ncbi:TetR/AcrR family transcriptional regulator [Kribbella sandramycini]|uniref:AcrR family transcriptional regulator n=1 Tax=Kribbella sandramycini TaxID=60450 RepID=A0A7Y4KYF5_9ACTN|nr:TetR/AcrR family transcriptional regulator [Kribbella sandramycini]MBB6569179.1 AcrR family transcriptional regulator [Kribbella sandramycini]NOL40980.1 TetR/AcrR family transcriptional regulator [Kribbella sandramycini]
MTQEYTGSGDPAKSLELLWRNRPRPTRGPKPALTVERIVAAALRIADAEGLGAMSMRRVADELGAGAMTLYRYVPGKGELLDVMLDAVYGELPRRPIAGDWRAKLDEAARANRDLYLNHPWMLQVAVSRPPLGPNVMAKYEYELAAIEGIGLTDVEMDATVALLNGYVHGAVRSAVEARQVIQRSGMSDKEWWLAHVPHLDRIADVEKYPLASRVGSTVGAEFDAPYDSDHAFEYGLARLLDGVATLVKDRR